MEGDYREIGGHRWRDGALDIKTQHLVALAASIAARCMPWAIGRFAGARQAGATEDEINEAVSFALRATVASAKHFADEAKQASEGQIK